MLRQLSSLYSQRILLWSLIKNDIKSRYLGSFIGAAWIFILPVINLLVMWFAFEKGLKVGTQDDTPFILWLITGMFPWIFFSDSISSATNSIVEKSFLVKKVVFQVELLPLVKIGVSLVLFSFLLALMILVFFVYGRYPNVYWLQLLYYTFCLTSLVLSLSWLSSSIVVFYRDLGQVIAVGLQIGFWATPIFWSPSMLPKEFAFVSALNPVSYIVTGFRQALIEGAWFWQSPLQTLYFWGVVSFFASSGILIFKKLRPHFADIL